MSHGPKDYAALDQEMDYAESRLPKKSIHHFLIFLFLGLFATMALMYFLFGAPRAHPRPDIVLNRPMTMPTLQDSPSRSLKEYKKAQQTHLHGYGWLDKAKGTVHIPIEVAIDMALQRGLYKNSPAPLEGKRPTEGKKKK